MVSVLVSVVLNFNSIKVQLKLLNSSTLQLSFCNFNSIKVQLKPPPATLRRDELAHFNSIKVQLKRLQQEVVEGTL